MGDGDSAKRRASMATRPTGLKTGRHIPCGSAAEMAPRRPSPKTSAARARRPLVRRIAKEHNVDISSLHGSGVGGRVTKHDILDYLDQRPAGAPSPQAHIPAFKTRRARRDCADGRDAEEDRRAHGVEPQNGGACALGVRGELLTRTAQLREQKKAEYERQGTKLTFLSFIARAVIESLRAFPVLNSSLDGDNIVYKKDINLGIAVALDWG
jgi:2-oxoglutarate dehydrogenase E2 component (dihydrolipoamide succinyltransferase)